MDSFFFVNKVCTLYHFGANGFTFLTISHLILKLMFLFFFNFQTCSLSVVEVLLCSNLKDDLCQLNLVLKSFSVCLIYVFWLFKVVSVTVALYTMHLVSICRQVGKSFFADSYIVFYLELIFFSFCAVVVSGGCVWILSV